MKLIQVPTIIGITWISNSNTIAGAISRYGVTRFHGNLSRSRPRALGVPARASGACVRWPTDVVILRCSFPGILPRVHARGRGAGSENPSTASGVSARRSAPLLLLRGGHLLLCLVQRGSHVGLGWRLARRRLLHELHHRRADVRLERRDS